MICRYADRLHHCCLIFLVLLSGCIPSQISHKAALGGQIDLTASIPMGKLLILNESVGILFDRTEQTLADFQKFYVKCKIMETSPSDDIGMNSFSFENDPRYREMTADLEFRKSALRILEKYMSLLCALSDGELDKEIDKSLVELQACIRHLGYQSLPQEHLSENYADLFQEAMQVIKQIDLVQKRADILRSVMNVSHRDVHRLVSVTAGSYEKHVSYLNSVFEKMLVSLNQKRPVHEDYYDPLLTVFDTEAAAVIYDYKTILNYLKLLSEALSEIPGIHLALADILGKKNAAVPELENFFLHMQKFEQVQNTEMGRESLSGSRELSETESITSLTMPVTEERMRAARFFSCT